MENAFFPGGSWCQLEDGAVSVSASCGSRAIEIAGSVKADSGDGSCTVGACAEIVEHTLGPFPALDCWGSKLENCSVTARAAFGSGAVEIPRRVQRQPRFGVGS